MLCRLRQFLAPHRGLRARSQRHRPAASVAVALTLLAGAAAGCGAERPDLAVPDGEQSLTGSSARPSTTPSTRPIEPSTTATTPPQLPEPSGSEVPLGDASAGAPSAPQVNRPEATGSTADPLGIYRGVLGSLGANDPVVPPVVEPPADRPGVLPLTGLPGAVPDRPAAVVKVDNSTPARPQAGLNAADIVVEEEVEGGATRFAAIYHSAGGGVGPVRSARTTDIGVLLGLGAPLLLYSGANDVTNALIGQHAAIDTRESSRTPGFSRDRARKAPHNLYTDAATHWARVAGGPPPPQFAYRAATTPVGGVADGSFSVRYRANRVSWTWDGAQWLRGQGSGAHLLASGDQVSAANVVVIATDRVDTGMVDAAGSVVPELVFVGSGPATVFTAGQRIDGIWTRPTLASVATLTTAEGAVIELTPGRTWIELIEAGSGALG